MRERGVAGILYRRTGKEVITVEKSKNKADQRRTEK